MYNIDGTGLHFRRKFHTAVTMYKLLNGRCPPHLEIQLPRVRTSVRHRIPSEKSRPAFSTEMTARRAEGVKFGRDSKLRSETFWYSQANSMYPPPIKSDRTAREANYNRGDKVIGRTILQGSDPDIFTDIDLAYDTVPYAARPTAPSVDATFPGSSALGGQRGTYYFGTLAAESSSSIADHQETENWFEARRNQNLGVHPQKSGNIAPSNRFHSAPLGKSRPRDVTASAKFQPSQDGGRQWHHTKPEKAWPWKASCWDTSKEKENPGEAQKSCGVRGRHESRVEGTEGSTGTGERQRTRAAFVGQAESVEIDGKLRDQKNSMADQRFLGTDSS
ncbi:hypothetical protein Bbelb_234750 [Branchiostoma belcheri]|nr:hypothetical protein Bbelb_234750 [Branchiostoma belcheri]